MGFYELYVDRDVLQGGLWFDPESSEYVEVIDMDDAAGEKGVTFVSRQSLAITEDLVRRALTNDGLFELEKPPSPPKSGKWWSPAGFRPKPRPGYLFWLPRIPSGYRIMESWLRWESLLNEGEPFPSLSEQERDDVLGAAESVHRYAGATEIETRTVIDKEHSARYRDQFPDATLTWHPKKAVLEILEEWGIPATPYA